LNASKRSAAAATAALSKAAVAAAKTRDIDVDVDAPTGAACMWMGGTENEFATVDAGVER
jgi:hypothetical protein